MINQMVRMALLFGVVVLSSGCNDQAARQRPSGLVYCAEGSPEVFNPQVTSSSPTLEAVSFNLYDRLLELNPNSRKLEGGLAESWVVDPDGRSYTLNLRKNVHFHATPWFTPTRFFNADDVIFSFKRIIDPRHPFHRVGGGYPYFESMGLSHLLKKVEKLGTYQVRFELERPNASFFYELASGYAVILSAEYGNQILKEGKPRSSLDRKPIGTGPFWLKEYRDNTFIRFERHANYWSGAARYNQLVYDITPKSAKRVAKVVTGACDVMSYPASSQISTIKKQPMITLSFQPGINVAYLGFNTQKEWLRDRQVRQAFYSAINHNGLLDSVYYGTGTIARSLIPSELWNHGNQFSEVKFDLKQARQQLDRSGFPAKIKLKLLVDPVARPYNPDPLKMAQLLSNDFSQLGIMVNIVPLSGGALHRAIKQGDYDLILSGWIADNFDPDNFLRQLLSCEAIAAGNNVTHWCDQKFQKLIDQAVTNSNHDSRSQYYQEAQQRLIQELPLIPLTHSLRVHAARDSISGLEFLPLGGVRFNRAQRN